MISEEGIGTEIKVTFEAEPVKSSTMSPVVTWESINTDIGIGHMPTISLLGFDENHEGTQLLRSVVLSYLISSWGFTIHEGPDLGDIVIVNEDVNTVIHATESKNISRPYIVFTRSRGNPTFTSITNGFELIGGFCRFMHKPGGPARLQSIVKMCLSFLKLGKRSTDGAHPSEDPESIENWAVTDGQPTGSGFVQPTRRGSENSHYPSRPVMNTRSSTAYPVVPTWGSRMPEESDPPTSVQPEPQTQEFDPTADTTISVGNEGTLLRSSVGALQMTPQRSKVLVVEDNVLIRDLLSVEAMMLSNQILTLTYQTAFVGFRRKVTISVRP